MCRTEKLCLERKQNWKLEWERALERMVMESAVGWGDTEIGQGGIGRRGRLGLNE